MREKSTHLSYSEVAASRARRLEMQHMQEIEGNPLDAEQIAMFEMFERERWSHEQCLDYILNQAKIAAAAKNE